MLHFLVPRAFALCGEIIGRFTSNPIEVTCPNCIAKINQGDMGS